MVLSVIILLFGLVLLKYGADYFIDGAKSLALRFKIPEIIIGLTVVAMGTSAPEFAVSLTSALHGANGIVLGNLVGSNIANVLLVLGITAMIATLPIKQNTVKFEMPFLFFITILVTAFVYFLHDIDRICGVVLFGLFVSFMGYLYIMTRKHKNTLVVEESSLSAPLWKMLVFIVLGLGALVWGGNLTVNSAVDIAHRLSISDRIIGLTIVAIGTSLPELIVCIVAALKKNTDLVIGNVIGSNIFNLLFVLGLTTMIEPIEIGNHFIVDLSVSSCAVLLLFLLSFRDKTLAKFDGLIFFIAYVVYICFVMGVF